MFSPLCLTILNLESLCSLLLTLFISTLPFCLASYTVCTSFSPCLLLTVCCLPDAIVCSPVCKENFLWLHPCAAAPIYMTASSPFFPPDPPQPDQVKAVTENEWISLIHSIINMLEFFLKCPFCMLPEVEKVLKSLKEIFRQGNSGASRRTLGVVDCQHFVSFDHSLLAVSVLHYSSNHTKTQFFK